MKSKEMKTDSKFTQFCKTVPIPLAIVIIIVFAFLCGGVGVAIFGLVPPPPLDIALAQESVFSQYVDESKPFEFPRGTNTSSHMYRDMLNGDSQIIYDELEQGMREGKEKISIAGNPDTGKVVAIGEAVLLDNPDIFWVSNSGFVTSGSSDGVALHPTYSVNIEDRERLSAEYDAVAESVVNYAKGKNVNTFKNDETTMYRIVSYVANNCSHGDASNADDLQNISSVFTSRESVCAGYAKSVCYIARKAGIPCVVIQGIGSGFFGANGQHAWVAAYVDGQIKLYDPYWFDMDVPVIDGWRWCGCSIDDAAFTSTHINSTPHMGL